VKKRSARQKLQEDRETVIRWKAEEKRNYYRKTPPNSLLQHSLQSTLMLKDLQSAERASFAGKVIQYLAKDLPDIEWNEPISLNEMMRRLEEAGVPAQTLAQLRSSLRQGAFWTMLESLTNGAAEGHVTRLRKRLEEGDIRALSEYVEATASTDQSNNALPIKKERALRGALKEEWVIQGLLGAIEKHPPAKDRGAPGNLTYEEKIENDRENNRKAKRQYDAKARGCLQSIKKDFEIKEAKLPPSVKENPTLLKRAQEKIADVLIAESLAKAEKIGPWRKAVKDFWKSLVHRKKLPLSLRPIPLNAAT
jgi:hypothetical protein